MSHRSLEFLDGIEGYNGNSRCALRNRIAYLFAAKNNIEMVLKTDIHQVQDLARCGIIVEENISTSDGLVKISKDNNIELIMSE